MTLALDWGQLRALSILMDRMIILMQYPTKMSKNQPPTMAKEYQNRTGIVGKKFKLQMPAKIA
jgi:RNase P subunit RPR2